MAAICRGVVRIQTLRSGILATTWIRTQRTAAAPQPPAPDVYTVPPPQPKEKKPGQLDKCQLEQYFDKGFVVIPKFFTDEEMEPAIKAVNECLDILANKLYNAGKIKDKCEDAGFYQQLILLEEQFKGAAVLMHKMGYLPPGFQNLWANERLLNVVEQLIGPNIAAHPVWNLRTKTPHNEKVTVPWHQDNAYLDPSALHTHMPTAWIPFIDANKENGCMQMVSGAHKHGFTATHTCCAGGTWYVDLDEEEMKKAFGVDMEKDVVTCEVPYGGLVLFNNCIPHRSLENYSDKTRWSIDLRWQEPEKPIGFYNLKGNVLMRKADDPNYQIDWRVPDFAVLERKQAEQVKEEDFDPTIHGPWMNEWKIVNHNEHTAKLKEGVVSSSRFTIEISTKE